MANISSEVHLFLGDSIYGDDYDYELRDRYPQLHGFLKPPVHVWSYYELMYRKLSCRSTFQSLVRRTKYVLSIWDDHDYGTDDEGGSNPMKYHSRGMFSNFWRLNEVRRRSNQQGIYGSYTFKGRSNSKSIVMILPDLKWDLNADTLVSDEQWGWLQYTIDVHSSSKIIMGLSNPFSSINNSHPLAASRLLGMFQNKRVVIVSGDPHTPFITRLSDSLVDITSSPLAQLIGHESEHHKCSSSCSVKNNQNNYGMLDLSKNKGYVMGKDGILLETDIF